MEKNTNIDLEKQITKLEAEKAKLLEEKAKAKEDQKGHRERLRKRFLDDNLSLQAFKQYEILEMLLFYSLPLCDTKGIAKNLLKEFGSLYNVLNADFNDLSNVPGVGPKSATLLAFSRELIKEYNLSSLNENQILNSTDKLIEYCKAIFIGAKNEQLRVICLDNELKLIKEALVCEGSIGKVEIDVRKIITIVLRHNCERIILTHNHPSSSCEPSNSDIAATRKIFTTLAEVNIKLEDHIIIGDGGAYSLRKAKVLPDIWR